MFPNPPSIRAVNWSPAPWRTNMAQQQLSIPGGNKKGTPLTQAEVGDITYWLKRITDDLDQNPNKRFAERDREWVAGARAELERRKGGGTKVSAPAPQSI